MALTPQDIGRIANLARLELSPQESERMLTQLNGFRSFDVVEQMRAVDTAGRAAGPPRGSHPAGGLRLRDDIASEPTTAKPTRRAPRCKRGLFLVPKVIE